MLYLFRVVHERDVGEGCSALLLPARSAMVFACPCAPAPPARVDFRRLRSGSSVDVENG
jgi:hypothetical protein